jgi:hypothetical protein
VIENGQAPFGAVLMEIQEVYNETVIDHFREEIEDAAGSFHRG